MATGTYGEIYYAEWASLKLQGYLTISKLGYTGAVSQLTMPPRSMEVVYAFDDWNSPIIGLQATFKIINDRDSYYELLPLLYAEEQEYKVTITVVYPYTQMLFEGFLNTDTITQKMLQRQTINFAASQYLLKMDNPNIYPLSIDTLKNETFISIINEILCRTGLFYNININCTLHEAHDTLTSLDTLFNKNGFYTELFWSDNVTRGTCLSILKSILTTFDCYLYWYDGFWYIERFEDLWATTKTYVQYMYSGVGGIHYSDPSVNGVRSFSVTLPPLDIHGTKFSGQTQTQAILPGMQIITINLNDKKFINIISNAWAGGQSLTPTTDAEILKGSNPNPTIRQWVYIVPPHPTGSEYTYYLLPTSALVNAPSPYTAGSYNLVKWSNFGVSYSDIQNAIQRDIPGLIDGSQSQQQPIQIFAPQTTSQASLYEGYPEEETIPSSKILTVWHPYLPFPNGLATIFRVTSNSEGLVKSPSSLINPTPPTVTINSSAELNLSWKVNTRIVDSLKGSAAWNTYTPSEWSVDFHYYIRQEGTNNYLVKSGTAGFVTSINSLSQWALMPCDDELTAMQTITVGASSFDPVTNTVTVSDSIPIGMALDLTGGTSIQSTLKGDFTFILLIGAEVFRQTSAAPEVTEVFYNTQFLQSWWGDFSLTATGLNQPNRIDGFVSNNFLNTKIITLDLYDCNSLLYKNGILYGDSLQYRTTSWGNSVGSTTVTAKGICWNTTGSPTIADSHTSDLGGFGVFTDTISGLSPATTYHVRAYATDGSGVTTYGNEVTFTTSSTLPGTIIDDCVLFYKLQPGDQGYSSGQNNWIGAAKADIGQIGGFSDKNGHTMWATISGSYRAGSLQWEVGWAADNSNIQNTVNTGSMRAIQCVDMFGGGNPYDATTLTKGALGSMDILVKPPVSGSGYWYFPTAKELLLMRAYNATNPTNPIPNLKGTAGETRYWSSSESNRDVSTQNGHTVSNLYPSTFLVKIPGVTDLVTIPGIDATPTNGAWAQSAIAIDMADPSAVAESWRKNDSFNIRCIKYITLPS